MVTETESREERQTDREKVNDLIFLLLSYKQERESREEIQTDREKVNDLIFLLLSYKQEMIR